jgi:2-isopropylmalate synthase
MSESLIHKWNPDTEILKRLYQEALVVDETLRDGLQGYLNRQPSIEEKIQFLEMMHSLGITDLALGFPAGNPGDMPDLARHIIQRKFQFNPYALARIVESDIDAIDEIAQETGLSIAVMLFVGSSPIRAFVEGWDFKEKGLQVEKMIKYAHSKSLEVIFATEDTTQSQHETIERLYKTALDQGVKRLLIADTVGAAEPNDVRVIINYFKNEIMNGFSGIELDWHGHNDLGLAVANSLQAIQSGVKRVHGTVRGIGERAGNAALEQLIYNMYKHGNNRYNLQELRTYDRLVSDSTSEGDLSPRQPIVGDKIFTTRSGIHTSAILAALELGGPELADLIYSSVSAGALGREQEFELNEYSGSAGVKHELAKLPDIAIPEELMEDFIKFILDFLAKIKDEIDYITLYFLCNQYFGYLKDPENPPSLEEMEKRLKYFRDTYPEYC